MKRRFGFTLIELVVVLLVVSILAVVAISKFINLSDDADRSQVAAVKASFAQAIDFSHFRWQTTNTNGPLNDLPDYAGGELDMNAEGYPLGIDKNNPMGAPRNVGRGDAGCTSLWTTLLDNPPTVSLNNDADYQAYRQRDSNGDRSICTFVYRANGDDAAPDSALLAIEYRSVDGTVTLIEN
ncbi:prepilin-type N-terminal cleavage/methylation domain-containing protein [Corallincola platygyrae]|uniref:Prepilin-type N-terminal cleavage/methylation domain-containing protein n=1 Tax=Corallincola platygyrae TaxID=1193278 RepID=A0ABW4XQJ7_9GAMM